MDSNKPQDSRTYTEIPKRTDPARRTYCDRCTRCISYHCDGSGARHYFIHVNTESLAKEGTELKQWLLRHTGFPE